MERPLEAEAPLVAMNRARATGIHRRLLQVTLVCWLLFTSLFLIAHGNETLEKDVTLFVAVVMAPILPLVLLPGAIVGGGAAEALLLVALQSIAVFPWLACVILRESFALRLSAFIGVVLYWIVMFMHL